MKKKISFTILGFCLLLCACGNQHNGNQISNINTANQNVPGATPTVTPLIGSDREFGEEETGIITISDSSDSSHPCEIKIDRPIIELHSSHNPKGSKVQWRVQYDCNKSGAPAEVDAQIVFENPAKRPFGRNDACDNAFFIHNVGKGKKARIISRVARASPGSYKYTIKAPGAADLDPQIQISSN